MMKTGVVFFLVFISIHLSNAQQNWNKMMHEGKNFYEIKSIFDKRYASETEKNSPSAKEDGWEQYHRWEEYWRHRILPDGSFPDPANLSRIYHQSQAHSSLSRGQTNWSYFGPKSFVASTVDFYPGSGRINALDINPSNSNELLVGAASSGIWKSIDKGLTWSSKTDELPILGISDIVRDPSNPAILYAATGDADAGRHPGTGIIKSTNGGETWSFVGLNQTADKNFTICRLAIPSSGILLATTFNGIFKSVDGGVNWVNTTEGNNVKGYSILIKPFTNSTIYVGTFDGDVLRSEDGGNSWTTLYIPDEIYQYGRIEIAVSPADENYLAALSENGLMAYSTDSGDTWTLLDNTPPDFDSQGAYNMTLAVSPMTTSKIIIGGVDGYKSIDGGQSWEKYLDGYWNQGSPNFYVHSDHHVMKFVPNTEILFTGNDGGLNYGDINSSNPFTDISEGLFITQYYGLGLVNTDSVHVIAGAQDNDGVFFNSSVPKGILPGSDGYDGLVDFTNPDKSYACSTGGGFMKTADGWVNFTTPDPNFSSNWDVQMKMNPINPKSLYLGGNYLVKSTNEGESWDIVFDKFSEITGMDISRTDTMVMYVQTETSGFWSTNDAGNNWKKLNLPSNFSSSDVNDVNIDPYDSKKVYITVGGYLNGQKVWMSDNGGQSWINISYNLPNIPVNCITSAASNIKGELFVGTDLGVWHYNPAGIIWEPFNDGLPYTPVSELNINYYSGSLFAATYGRGIWHTKLASIPVSTGEIIGSFSSPVLVTPTISKSAVFNLSFPENMPKDNIKIRVFNVAGGLVYSKTVESPHNLTLDLGGTHSGIYFVQISQGADFQTTKIMITN